MIRRHVNDEDLLECLQIHPGHIGAGLIGLERAVDAWKTLLRSSGAGSVVIESERPIAGHRIVGFGASVMVSRAFIEDEVANPRIGLNDRVIANASCGGPECLDDAAIWSANASGGLDLVVLYGAIRNELTGDHLIEARTLLAQGFLEHHVGYRFRQMICEPVGPADQDFCRSTHIWRIVARFDAEGSRHAENDWGPDRVLAIAKRQDAVSAAGSMAAIVFQYQDPTLSLSFADRQLLTAALDAPTDDALSARLQLSVAAIKKRWAAVFFRVSTSRPDLFPEFDTVADDRRRGPQKRHRLLAYVRAHPEELRPVHPRWLR